MYVLRNDQSVITNWITGFLDISMKQKSQFVKHVNHRHDYDNYDRHDYNPLYYNGKYIFTKQFHIMKRISQNLSVCKMRCLKVWLVRSDIVEKLIGSLQNTFMTFGIQPNIKLRHFLSNQWYSWWSSFDQSNGCFKIIQNQNCYFNYIDNISRL